MLFDLRGRGRRRTVQAIYLSLAILMGGGLVLFGIGSDTSGGLFDAISATTSGTSATASDRQAHRARARRHAPATEGRRRRGRQLAQSRYQRAGIDGIAADGQTYTEKGKKQLRAGRHRPGSATSRWTPSSRTCARRSSWFRPTTSRGSTS